MKFDARIDGTGIAVTLTADRALSAPVFCFSLMAPAEVVSGGTLAFSCAGYCEVVLPDLAPGTPHSLRMKHMAGFHPTNRAWLPLGAHLRAEGETIPLPPLPSGRRPAPLMDGPPPELRIVPPVASFTPSGETATATGFHADPEAFAPVEALAERTGLGPFLDPAGLPLRVAVDGQVGPEAYTLDIAPDGIVLTASSRTGRFYGAITLLTLKTTHGGRLPCGRIEDAPRFGWRGQHLDCARHFFQPDTIARLMDLMALLKLNRFHWHFADDEAFRLEIESLPELWQKTAFRGAGELVPGVFGGGARAGGSYSLEDARRLIAHGQALEIGILPEIEAPAHAFALARVFPDTRDAEDTGTEASVQGYPGNVLNPAIPETWRVLEAMAQEVAGLFPLGLLHLGCDELPEGAWDGSPAAAALKERENLVTRDDLQGWTMERLAAGIAPVRPAAWEEAARGRNGGIGHDALLFSWSGQGPGIEAARAGYDVVMCPAQNVYLDLAHSAEPDDWGASWAGFIPLEQTLAWSPVPADAPDIAPRVVGVQGTFWGEFTTHDREMEAMVAPRILGVAAKAWDRTDRLTGPELHALARAYLPILDAMGWESGYR